MGRPVHFEIHAADPERIRDFYEQVFGWDFQRWGEQQYWMVTTGADGTLGINGGLLPRQGPAPAAGASPNAFVITVSVDDVDATVERALGLGASLAMPRMAVPGVGHLAYLADPDGNLVGALQPDEAAA
jgi:predicted enzyme related to lactoylglutathione lyase